MIGRKDGAFAVPGVKGQDMECGISPQFAARLANMKSTEPMQVVVVLDVSRGKPQGGARISVKRRKALAKKTRSIANSLLPAIDAVVEKFNGQRVSKSADSLGCIVIKLTPSGIRAVAALDDVRAVMEDQPILAID